MVRHVQRYRQVLAQPFTGASAAAFKRMHELQEVLAGRTSSKLEWLRDLIQSMEEQDKVVVVSGRLAMLDSVQQFAAEQDWNVLRIDGSTTASSRMANIDSFNTEAKWKLFLLAKEAGGAGVNLVGANWLIMCEPGWNPAIDRQASGRIWRPGQHRACTILTLISQHTIEEKIMLRACSKQGCWPLCPAMASSQELRRVFDYPVPTLWSALGGEARGTASINGVAWKSMRLPVGLVMTKCLGLAQDSRQQPSGQSASTPESSSKKSAKKRLRVASNETGFRHDLMVDGDHMQCRKCKIRFVKKNKYMYTSPSGVYACTCVAE